VFFNSLQIALGKAARQVQPSRYAAEAVTFKPQSAQFKQAVQNNLQRSLMRRRPAVLSLPR
jgi:hypothetical protein